MPKEPDPNVIENSRNIVEQTIDSFSSIKGPGGYPEAAAVRMFTTNHIANRAKRLLKQVVGKKSQKELEEIYGKNIYLSEAIGSWANHRLSLASSIPSLIDIEGTGMSELEMLSFVVADYYQPGYYGNERPKSYFRKFVRQTTELLDKHGHLDLDERTNKVYPVESVNPVDLMVDFWGDILYKSRSSFKRTVCSAVASLRAPEYEDMASFIRDFHSGDVYNFKDKDVDSWYLLIGDRGAGFAFMGPDRTVHLQFEKPRYLGTDLNPDEIDGLDEVRHAIQMMPFVSKDQISKIYPDQYSNVLRVWNRNEHLAPVNITGSYVSRELAHQLNWSIPKDVKLEQSTVLPVIRGLWEYINPTNRGEINEASDVAISLLTRLYIDKEYAPRTSMEERTLDYLSDYLEKEPNSSKYFVKDGVLDQIGYLAMYMSGFK